MRDRVIAATSRLSAGAQQAPKWFDSLLFLALMSGPPRFRDRDTFASLAGAIDAVVLVHIVVWTCGGLWVLARLYPGIVRRNVIPSVNPVQAVALLFIGALTLSLWDSPGVLLTAFTLGQFAVMLGFAWVFTHRFGASASLRHLFIGACVLALAVIVTAVLAPGLVADGTNIVAFETRIRGDVIVETASVAAIGLVLCLSSVPALRGPMFWAVLSLFGALLAVSRTRTAYVAILGFLVMGFVYGKGLRVRKLVLPLAAITFSIFFMDALLSTTEYLVRERESIRTMSDRIPLWEHLVTAVMRESPITGLGYYAASRLLATQYNANLGNAHSAFVEVFVGGGMLAATLYIALCASLLWYALHLLWVARIRPTAVASAGLLVVALIMGITSEASMHAGPLGFSFWMTTALLPRLCREASRERSTRTHPAPAMSSSLRVRHV
jgi:O-antigen ligase